MRLDEDRSLLGQVSDAREFASWIRSKGHGLGVPKSTRGVTAGATFSLTIDHFDGVVTLMQARLAGPALALIRPLFESYVQGLWVFRVADDAQIKGFLEKRSAPTLRGMLSAIDGIGFFESSMRVDMKGSIDAMHGFTHGGPRHVANRFDGNNLIKALYSADLLVDALHHANAFAFMALLEMIAMADDQALGDQVYVDGCRRLGLQPRSAPV